MYIFAHRGARVQQLALSCMILLVMRAENERKQRCVSTMNPLLCDAERYSEGESSLRRAMEISLGN